MFKLCLHFNESQPIHAYKRYPYKKGMYIINQMFSYQPFSNQSVYTGPKTFFFDASCKSLISVSEFAKHTLNFPFLKSG